jgi:hypothetical protein
LPVKYSKDRPVITVGGEDSDVVLYQKALLTKAEFWQYENEWRFSDYKGGRGLREIPADALTGIILGAKISDKNEKMVRGWIADRSAAIELKRAKFDEEHFRLNLIQAD